MRGVARVFPVDYVTVVGSDVSDCPLRRRAVEFSVSRLIEREFMIKS